MASKKAEGKGKGKKDKGKKGAASSSDSSSPSVAAHPKAARQVARWKSFGGLIGFLLGGYLSLPTHTFVETGVRALVAGGVCYVAVWAAAVFVWRRLLVLEIRDRKQEMLDAAYAGAPDRLA
jgi:predicted lipid-binding transport protein (Tim44 family)